MREGRSVIELWRTSGQTLYVSMDNQGSGGSIGMPSTSFRLPPSHAVQPPYSSLAAH